MTDHERIENAVARLSDEFRDFRGEVRSKIAGFEQSIEAIAEMREPLEEMTSAWRAGGGVIKFGGALGRFMKWAVGVGSALALGWAALKSGGHIG